MTAIDRVQAAAAFKTYTDAYDAANPRIALKSSIRTMLPRHAMPWHVNRVGHRRTLTWRGCADCCTIWVVLNSCDAGTPLRTPRA